MDSPAAVAETACPSPSADAVSIIFIPCTQKHHLLLVPTPQNIIHFYTYCHIRQIQQFDGECYQKQWIIGQSGE